MILSDRLTFDGKPRRTSDGYLVASVKAARTGVQDYAGSEVGKPDMARVRVYRPEAEVFNKDALASFTSIPVTVDHPPVAVTADNWRDFAVGNVGEEIARDGEFIRVPIIVKDAKAIRDIENGRRELSMGYTTDLKWETGTTPAGETYDAIQTNLRGNHLAIVSAARGGPELKIGDSEMTTRTITVDGIRVQMDDQTAAIVEKAINRLADMEKKAKEDEEEFEKVKKESATKDAQIATLTSQLADASSPAKIADAARALADTIGKAKAILPAVVTDGRSIDDIRKQVVSAKLGDVAKDWTADQIAASFGTLTATVKATDTLAAALSSSQPTNDKAAVAYDSYLRRLQDGYKTVPGVAKV